MPRVYFFLVVFAIACALSSRAFAADRYALLVGVKEYDQTQLTNLRFSEADVTELSGVLKGAGFRAANVVLMTQAAGAAKARALPTAARIRAELDLILTRAGADDTLIVAFAGHGVQFKGETGAYFCPMDADLEKRDSLIALDDVYRAISKCPARTKLLLVDACRNEVATEVRRAAGGVELEAVGRPQSVKLPEGIAAYFSCDVGQFAYESPDVRHGVFFHFVLKGLRGEADVNRDNQIGLTELELFVSKRVKDYVATEFGKSQSPRLVTKFDGAPVIARLGEAPPQAAVPFGATQADEHQQEWAGYLKVTPVVTNSLQMKLSLIPPGEFLMGSPASEADREEQETQHRVRISNPFYLAQTEVTVGQFRAFVNATNFKTEGETDGNGCSGYNAATNKRVHKRTDFNWRRNGWPMNDDHPVANVSWNDAQAFCAWLSKKEGKTYRLPTEAEWEYACRAGTLSAFHHGEDRQSLVQVANIADGTFLAKKPDGADRGIDARDGYVYTSPVGRFRPNAFGLYDMHGNLWEWCQDWHGAGYYDLLKERTAIDPQGDPKERMERVFRGGCCFNAPWDARSAYRFASGPGNRDDLLGFRVVRVP